MTKNKILNLFLVLTFSFQLVAQQSATFSSDLVDYQKALSLYVDQQFAVSQFSFKQVQNGSLDKNLNANCAYYIASCDLKLNRPKAVAGMEEFVKNHPSSIMSNSAYMELGDYYFNKGAFNKAKPWYDMVNEQALNDNDLQRYYFNKGYTAFSEKQYRKAKTYLKRVENSDVYGKQAKYYIGFMAYEGDDYKQADRYFNQVNDQERYKEKMAYYKADLNFKSGNFEDAIKFAKERLSQTKDEEEISELSKIIGESFFNLESYEKSIPYLQAYKGKKSKRGNERKWNNTDYYQLGYAYYKQSDYEKAISEFNKIIGGKNAVAQNAYYHLAESYAYLNKKQEALQAFRNASEMSFDLKIQEDAWLNYAKISYEIGNPYQSVPEVLTEFLHKYPNSNSKEDIETLLIDSYITSKNYPEAIKLLKDRNGFEDKKAYQKVTFYRGLELYNESKFLKANYFFNESLKHAIDQEFKNRAVFWRAEMNYNLTNFNEALLGFKAFEQESGILNTTEATHLDYNLAYTYFKLKNYPKAISYFNKYIEGGAEDKLRLNDAYLRLADAYFVSTEYSSAIKAYENALAINEIESDYAYFQKTISAGYLGQTANKISGLERFVVKYPKSKLCDDAIYELGNTYVKVNNTNSALKTYDILINDYKSSQFIPKALLRQGLIYYNATKNEQALSKLKQVASDYPKTPDAIQAISTARLIYIDIGQVNEYGQWVRQLDYVEVTDADLDNTTYESAEKQYLDNNGDKAIEQFNGYLASFPNGIHVLNAHFYLAQLYFKSDLMANAEPHYAYVVNASQNEFSEVSLLRLSNYYLENDKLESALPILLRLELEADLPNNTIFAKSNLMKAYFKLENYDKAVDYAEKVLSTTKIDHKIRSDAQVIIARSAMKTDNEDRARKAYAALEKVAKGEVAAEALYYNAYFKYKAADYQASNESIQKLAKDYSSYKYYSAKGLVLMAKNFYALEDAFQATYILESVIKNFVDFEDVVQEAEAELNSIKEEEAKTNASLETLEN